LPPLYFRYAAAIVFRGADITPARRRAIGHLRPLSYGQALRQADASQP
jgi:hypothetical protein